MADANGHPVTAYAKKIATDDPRKDYAYDLGDVMKLTVEHGNTLREKAKQAYLASGDALNDSEFALRERSDTMKDLFATAAARHDGGREYSGYRMVYGDYSENTVNMQVF